MRLELLLAMGSTSLALSATVASVFGMNLLSGLETSPHLFWAVSAGGAPVPIPMPASETHAVASATLPSSRPSPSPLYLPPGKQRQAHILTAPRCSRVVLPLAHARAANVAPCRFSRRAAAGASAGLMGALLLGLRRFRASQRRHLHQSAALERTLAVLDGAYYALRRNGALAAHDAEARDGGGGGAADSASAAAGATYGDAGGSVGLEEGGGRRGGVGAPPGRPARGGAGLTMQQLRAAVESRSSTAAARLTDDELRCLWEAFDADGDGTLDADELPVGRISLGDLKGLGGGG